MTSPTSNQDLLGHLPAIPREWLFATAQQIIGLAVALGVDLTPAQQLAVGGASVWLTTLVVIGGVALRRGRAKHLGQLFADPAVRALVDELPDELKRVRDSFEPPTSASRRGAVTRQLTAVEGEAERAAEVEREQPPPEPGTYPPDEPAGDEPTGS